MELDIAGWAVNPQSVPSKASEQWEAEYNKEKKDIEDMLVKVKKGKFNNWKVAFVQTLERQDVLLANNHTYRQTMHVNNEMTDALKKKVEMLEKDRTSLKSTVKNLIETTEQLLTANNESINKERKHSENSVYWKSAYLKMVDTRDKIQSLLKEKIAAIDSAYQKSQTEISEKDDEIEEYKKKLIKLCVDSGGAMEDDGECYHDSK